MKIKKQVNYGKKYFIKCFDEVCNEYFNTYIEAKKQIFLCLKYDKSTEFLDYKIFTQEAIEEFETDNRYLKLIDKHGITSQQVIRYHRQTCFNISDKRCLRRIDLLTFLKAELS